MDNLIVSDIWLKQSPRSDLLAFEHRPDLDSDLSPTVASVEDGTGGSAEPGAGFFGGITENVRLKDKRDARSALSTV